jgi:hypothetical protein
MPPAPPSPLLLPPALRVALLALAGAAFLVQLLALLAADPPAPYLAALPAAPGGMPLPGAGFAALLGAVGLAVPALLRRGRLAWRLLAAAATTGALLTAMLLLVMAVQAGALEGGPLHHASPPLWYGVLASLLLDLALLGAVLGLARRGRTWLGAGQPPGPRTLPPWARLALLATAAAIALAQATLLSGVALRLLALAGMIGWAALALARRETQAAGLAVLCLADSLVVAAIVARHAGIAVALARSPLLAAPPPAPAAWQLWLGVEFPLLVLPLLLAATAIAWASRRVF